MANMEVSDSPIDSQKRADRLNRKASRKRNQAARKEKRAAKAEAKGKTGKAAILRGKAKKKTGKAEVKEARADRAANRGKQIKEGAKKAVKGAKKLNEKRKEIKGKVKSAVKGKVADAKKKVKAKVDTAKKNVKAKINKAATAVAGATAPPMEGPSQKWGGNKGDYHREMDAEGHMKKTGDVGGGKYGKGGHYKDYEGGSGMYEGPSMADSDRLTGAGSEGDPGLGRMSEGDKAAEAAGKAGLMLPKSPGMYGRGSKISYGNYHKPNMHKGNGKEVHGSPFPLSGSKLSKHFKK